MDVDALMRMPVVLLVSIRLRLARGTVGPSTEVAADEAIRLAERARRTVPYYRALYGDRVLDDLQEIPLADKASMVDRPFEELLSGPMPQGSRTLVTSGTTGVPMTAVYSPGLARWYGLLAMTRRGERGIRPRDRRTGFSFASDDRHRGRLASRVRRHGTRRSRSLALDGSTSELVDQLVSWSPDVLSGHPHRLLDVGMALPDGWRPRVLFTHGETIDEVLRASLARAYGTVPIDSYGTTEAGPVAFQCSRGDLYHVEAASVLVEILDDDDHPVRPGEVGNVVITSLKNHLMPFIRYRMADRSALAARPCACGHRGPALTTIVGRASDFAVDASGRPVSPERLWLYLHADADTVTEVVRRYHVHQVADGTIEVRLELRAPMPEGFEADLVASYDRVGTGWPVVVRVVADLGEARPGKFRLISSDLGPL